jgi:hypothetical protein
MFWFVSGFTIWVYIYAVFKFLVSIAIIVGFKMGIYDFICEIWIVWNKWKDKQI